MTFDIRSLTPSETAIMPIRDVAGNIQQGAEGSEPGIEYYGPGTRIFVNARHEYLEAARKMVREGKKTTADDETRIRADFLTKITKRLVNFDFPGGPAALYRDLELNYIAEDGYKFADDRGNFKRSSAPSSPNTSVTQPG